MPTNDNGFVVFGAIEGKWLATGGPQGRLGHPLSNETPTFDRVGRYQNFQGGIIAWRPETSAHIVWGLIGARWLQIGREQFGYPTTDESTTPDGIGKYNHFRAFRPDGSVIGDSSIYWTSATGAHEIFGAIRDKWASVGWETSRLGYPLANEQALPDGHGRAQNFQGGVISWRLETAAHIVWGSIEARWLQLSREQFGYPITDEMTAPDGRGKYNHFRAFKPDGSVLGESSIYWLPETGAHEVYGAIRDKWASIGWERGILGYPVDNEQPTFDGVGSSQNFQGGIVSWRGETGAYIVRGLIAARWADLGRERFGYPIRDETATPDGRGRFNHFRAYRTDGSVVGESSIYWLPELGAHEVYGAIRDRWAKRGWETSSLGYPIAAEHDRGDGPGREQQFQHGRIVWSPNGGTLFDPLVFTTPIVTGGLAALGGWVTVTVYLDGSVRWEGHMHDSGADGYDFGITALVKSPSGRAIALAHTGHTSGTFTSGSRDDDWNTLQPASPMVAAFLADYNDAELVTDLNYDSAIGSTLEKVVGWIIKFGLGTISGPVGAVVFVGVEVGSLITSGSLVPGARIIEGVLWMAGPTNTLFALLAEGIASLGSRTRQLTQEEYDWANGQVFAGSLPPLSQLVLTDTIGAGNRAFTFPRYDGKTTLNMGSDAFADPRNYPGKPMGQTFIHELVHSCQINHSKIELGLLADALASKVCEATGGNPYAYGPAGPDYSTFNLEQQAQMVSDWYSGAVPAGTNQSSTPKDTSSPYFPYVNEVRLGKF
jgi:uncharacterized protein with LGFP repeats